MEPQYQQLTAVSPKDLHLALKLGLIMLVMTSFKLLVLDESYEQRYLCETYVGILYIYLLGGYLQYFPDYALLQNVWSQFYHPLAHDHFWIVCYFKIKLRQLH